ncbi:MAG: clostripain-related cysteine peptidase [bacterium]|nr:clostripain-related cysteine peptidase [bacterium]
MVTKKQAYHLFIIWCLFLSVSSAASWRVFVYMDSSDNLNDMAIKNISDMIRGKPHDTIDFLIQLHAYDTTALRYRITGEGLVFIEDLVLSGDSKQDFIQAAQWAFADSQADHTMFIAWNHGWGILDPQWNPQTEKWETSYEELGTACSIRSDLDTAYRKNYQEITRGFMFTVNPRMYLNNQDLIDGLSFIKENVLHGKKFDILAFDTCMGGMLEIAYQVAPYAHYLVGNQTCSMRDGFNYQDIVAILNQEPSPKDMATGMVEVFDAYYTDHDGSGSYAHTALDLELSYQAKEALDKVVTQVLNIPNVEPLLVKAREQAPRFCLFPMYTDVVSFCKRIDEQLTLLPLSVETLTAQQVLKSFYTIIQKLVVARCGGFSTQGKAHGVAIYLPSDGIDNSYYTTMFGRDSQWINLLEKLVY